MAQCKNFVQNNQLRKSFYNIFLKTLLNDLLATCPRRNETIEFNSTVVAAGHSSRCDHRVWLLRSSDRPRQLAQHDFLAARVVVQVVGAQPNQAGDVHRAVQVVEADVGEQRRGNLVVEALHLQIGVRVLVDPPGQACKRTGF